MKFPNLRFQQELERATVNLSFSASISTAILAVHLQRSLSTIKDAVKKQ